MVALNVLVVDDSPIMIKKMSATLKKMGHEVVATAGTGLEAIEEYGQSNPDLVTMDISMPDMDGVTATREIIRHYPDARIIMVTAHGQQQMVLDAMRAGAAGYVLKPVEPAKLNQVILGILKKKTAMRW